MAELKQFRRSILKRMIKDGSLKMNIEELEQLYHSHKERASGMNRFTILKREVTEQERDLIKDYFNPELEVKAISQKRKINSGVLYRNILRIALRMVYQRLSIDIAEQL